MSTVTWDFGFTDNSLTENQPGVTEDSFTSRIVLTINDVNVSTNLPKLLEIGVNTVKYTVTDPAGNSATCSFFVKVSGSLITIHTFVLIYSFTLLDSAYVSVRCVGTCFSKLSSWKFYRFCSVLFLFFWLRKLIIKLNFSREITSK